LPDLGPALASPREPRSKPIRHFFPLSRTVPDNRSTTRSGDVFLPRDTRSWFGCDLQAWP
jgi:hypothetical protein